MYTMRKLAYLILLVIFPTGCDFSTGGGLDRPPEGPKILRVEISPEYITVGDTVTVRCVIADTLNLHNNIYSWGVYPPTPTGAFNENSAIPTLVFTVSYSGEYTVYVGVKKINPETLETITSVKFNVNE